MSGVSGEDRVGGTHVWGVKKRQGGVVHMSWGVRRRQGGVVHMSRVSGEDRVGGTHVWGVCGR